MIGQTITFDGHRLNDRFYVGEPDIGLPDFQPSLEDRATGDGSEFRGMRLGAVSIDIRLTAKPVWGETARDALTDLLSWLNVDSPRWLDMSGDRGRRRLCVPSGAPTIEDPQFEDRVTVHLTQVDPALYGARRTVTVPSGGSVSFRVGGDYPTAPVVVAPSAVRDATSRRWGVRLDDGDVLRVAIPTSAATAVSIDCAELTCAVGGATALPDMESLWLELRPGNHVIRNDVGTGACTVSWHERWHR